ncbi:TauD/TfdA dioxygenase family protein [Pseudooceanicola atlanticus]|uniref:TauD/TfdA dioxygenase family protein n=1 Tax=Pseudooceanicola atlanticus TaxID=1461694 RepID=UPI002356B68B|nr:TauD/TfdA family dioxygenase [Pseudooceanicola atlanticus]
MQITPNDDIMGAVGTGIDLSQPLPDEDFARIFAALGRHGVICFPDQSLDAGTLKQFSERFGGLQTSLGGLYTDPVHPEVMTLSNMVKDGKPLGLADAGQDWHTDMSYNQMIGFVNVLFAVEVPQRHGKPLGGTVFANMKAAYDDLPEDMKTRLADATCTHDFNKFWEAMRARPGSTRPPLSAEQRAKRPPATHPLFLTHPITGDRILYANPGYAMRINELPEDESAEVLEFLFAHQLQEKYQYTHHWTKGDVLIWDHIGTLHNAIADYGPDEHRMMIRCQVYADKVFDPSFVQHALGAAA